MQNKTLMQLAVLASISAISCFLLYGVYRKKHQELQREAKKQTTKQTTANDKAGVKECVVPETDAAKQPQKEPSPTPAAEKKKTTTDDPPTPVIDVGQDEATEATKKYKAGQYKEAIELYTQAIKKCEAASISDQRNLKVMYSNRAAAYEKLDDFQNVIDDCTKALKLDKRHPKSYLRRAKAKGAMRDLTGALVDFVCLLVLSEQKGEQVDEQLALDITQVHTDLTAEQVKESMKKLKQSNTKRFLPDTFFITSYYSSFHPDDDENDVVADKSVNEYTQELETFGQSSDVRVERGELLVKRALAHKQQEQYEEAAKDLDAACALLQSGDVAYYTAHVENGTYYHLRGEFEEAKRHFEAALDAKPTSIYAKIRMGGLSFDQKDLNVALQWFDKALSEKPASPTAHFHRGQLHSIDPSGDPTSANGLAVAFQDLERCIELAPDFTMAYIQLGVTYARTGSLDKAVEYLKLALQLSPKIPEIYNYLGETYMQMLQMPGSGIEPKQVEDMFSQAIAMDPSYPMAYINQGNLMMQRGSQYGHEALSLFEKAVEMCPRSKFAHSHLAQVYMAMQDFSRAIQELDHALAYAFTEEELRELLGVRITAQTHQKAQLLLL